MAGSQHPPDFGTTYVRAHSMRNDNQISHVDQTRTEEKFFRGRLQMPMHDLFVVAKFLVKHFPTVPRYLSSRNHEQCHRLVMLSPVTYRMYEGRSINKLQNNAILLVFQNKKSEIYIL